MNNDDLFEVMGSLKKALEYLERIDFQNAAKEEYEALENIDTAKSFIDLAIEHAENLGESLEELQKITDGIFGYK